MSKIDNKVKLETAKEIAQIIRKPETKGGGRYTPRYIQMVLNSERKNLHVQVMARQYLEKKKQLQKDLAMA